MLKKSITYTDFNGETVTEDHFFHLSKADLIKMEVSQEGGLGAYLTRIVESENGKAIMEEFEKLLKMSYGKKSDDGRRFIKTPDVWDEFVSSEAYSTLFMELVTDGVAASAFVNGIVPQGLAEEMQQNTEQSSVSALPPSVITRSEAIEMDPDELKHLLATGAAILK